MLAQRLLLVAVSLCLLCVLDFIHAESTAATLLAEPGSTKGFFDEGIHWMGLKNAREVAAKESKPICVLIHSQGCGACKNLKSQFQKAGGERDLVADLAKKFVMVNLEDDEANGLTEFEHPAGERYIPRLFFEVNQKTLVDVHGPNAKYPYFFSTPKQIADAMEKVLSLTNLGEKAEL